MFTYWKVADDDSDQLKDQEQIFWVLWRIETNFIMYKKFDEFNTTSDIIINVTAYIAKSSCFPVFSIYIICKIYWK